MLVEKTVWWEGPGNKNFHYFFLWIFSNPPPPTPTPPKYTHTTHKFNPFQPTPTFFSTNPEMNLKKIQKIKK